MCMKCGAKSAMSAANAYTPKSRQVQTSPKGVKRGPNVLPYNAQAQFGTPRINAKFSGRGRK